MKLDEMYLSAPLAFYCSARDELLERVKLRDQVLMIYLAFSGAIFGTALNSSDKLIIAEVLPFLGLGASILVNQHNNVIGSIIRYLNEDLFIHTMRDYDSNIPDYVNSSSFKRHSQTSNLYRLIGHSVIILVPSFTGIVINYKVLMYSSFPLGPASWFGVLFFLISAYIIFIGHGGRAKVFTETTWSSNTTI